MSIYSVRRSVACYVTRTTAECEQLLVLEPPAGTDDLLGEIPVGEMLPFEAIVEAAQRVLAARTGLTELTYVGQLGGVEIAAGEPGGAAMTTYVHLTAPSDGPARWEQVFDADGAGADAAHEPSTTVCEWVDLPLEIELAEGHGAFLDDALA